MKKEELIELRKNEFIKKFNKDRSIGTAKKKALGAAFQRNQIYSGVYNPDIRIEVRNLIYKFLDNIKLKYSVSRTEAEYEEDILALEKYLKHNVPNGIDNLKISHTQKVLSVFLKHLWCLGLIPVPPQFPVDRNTLLILYPQKTPSWTKIASIEEYQAFLNDFKHYISNSEFESLKIAEWELIAFQYIIERT